MWPLLVTTRIGNDLSWLAVKISVPSPVEYSPATHGTVAPSTLTVVFPQLPSIYHTHKQTNKHTTPREASTLEAFAVEVPAGTTELGEEAFELCKGLTEVTLPPGLTHCTCRVK